MGKSLISLKGIDASYGTAKVLHDVNIEVARRERPYLSSVNLDQENRQRRGLLRRLCHNPLEQCALTVWSSLNS